jgi:hypothetical protein
VDELIVMVSFQNDSPRTSAALTHWHMQTLMEFEEASGLRKARVTEAKNSVSEVVYRLDDLELHLSYISDVTATTVSIHIESRAVKGNRSDAANTAIAQIPPVALIAWLLCTFAKLRLHGPGTIESGGNTTTFTVSEFPEFVVALEKLCPPDWYRPFVPKLIGLKEFAAQTARRRPESA